MKLDYTVAMQRAIALAEKGLGKTAPNPIVGAVIVDSTGSVIAETSNRKQLEFDVISQSRNS